MGKNGNAGSAALNAALALAGVAAATAGGLWLYNRYGRTVVSPLPPALDAERREIESMRAGRLSYYADTRGEGRPLVLIHSINAAAAAHEMKPLFEHYRGQRPVYALDLPGFGFSERSARRYSPDLYVAAITDFLQTQVGGAADVVALSLGSEFAARVALEQPEQVRSLALLSPSGLAKEPIELPGDWVYNVIGFGLWGPALFDALTTPGSIRLFLGRNFAGEPAAFFLDYAYKTAHQPGAERAPLYFVSGQLFTGDIRTAVYARLQTPALVIYDRDPNVTFDGLPLVMAANAHWRESRVGPSLGLPHWDNLAGTIVALDTFWSELV